MKNESGVCADELAVEFLLAHQYCNELKKELQDMFEDEHLSPIVKVLEVKPKFENGGFSLVDPIRCIPSKLTITFRLKDSVSEQSVDMDSSDLVRRNSTLRVYLKDLCKRLGWV
jgi:hypothetical protein